MFAQQSTIFCFYYITNFHQTLFAQCCLTFYR